MINYIPIAEFEEADELISAKQREKYDKPEQPWLECGFQSSGKIGFCAVNHKLIANQEACKNKKYDCS
jgi:hypothetical protein